MKTLDVRAHNTIEDARLIQERLSALQATSLHGQRESESGDKSATEDRWEHLAAETHHIWKALKTFCALVESAFEVIEPFSFKGSIDGHPAVAYSLPRRGTRRR